jgi:hypothetical protein
VLGAELRKKLRRMGATTRNANVMPLIKSNSDEIISGNAKLCSSL